jgi:hypothetical protein
MAEFELLELNQGMGKPQLERVGFVACIFFVGIDARCLALDSAGDETTLAGVVVTGSRIPTAIADETLPTTILDAKDLARGGSDSLGKILQRLPMSATSVMNTNVNNGGNGSARVDLRPLRQTCGHKSPA